jgi:(Z)-2-((N-methylformamido)methylene)-5-hydroxybutyrolactone dehydrogenase
MLDYIAIGKSEGARVVLGGCPADKARFGDGWFVDPTIFTGVDNRMRIAQEEIFGPVLSVIPFTDEDEAIAIANDTVYGLAAGVWTQSMRRALLMSERLRAGTVWVNTYRAVSFMSALGGYKRSGLGRESGKDAIYEYPQQKSVWISTATRGAQCVRIAVKISEPTAILHGALKWSTRNLGSTGIEVFRICLGFTLRFIELRTVRS